MARVTVEDCIEKVDNRFDLVLISSHRARAISSGSPINVARDNDKNPVVALREIGDGKLSPGDLREDLIHALQKHVEVDEPEAEAAPLMVNPIAQSQIDAGAEPQFDRMTEEDLLRGLRGACASAGTGRRGRIASTVSIPVPLREPRRLEKRRRGSSFHSLAQVLRVRLYPTRPGLVS